MARVFYNSESFNYAKDLSQFAGIYDLAAGELRREMRINAADVNIQFWWSTSGEAEGLILLSDVPSTGWANFTGNPTAAEALNIGGTTITFVASAPSGNQVLIGADVSATLNSLATFLSASVDTQLAKCTYRVIETDKLSAVAITHKTAGTAGNNFRLTTTSSVIATSSATLTHGGTGSVETATYEQVQDFVGDYVTDLLFISGPTRVVLERETFTFEQGVTR
jgi:hypothetical protein